MNEDKFKVFYSLLYAYGQASEELGGLESSYGWNSVNSKVERAESAVTKFVLELLNK